MSQAWNVADANDYWSTVPIGDRVGLRDDLVGVTAPPTDRHYRYVLMTAGEDGVGQYNEGALDDEIVSGSSPDIDATAVISLADSPMLGQTIRLVNTTREFERPGSPGTVQADAFRAHNHGYTRPNNGAGGDGGASVVRTSNSQQTTTEGGEETRPRNVGVTVYMRIR